MKINITAQVLPITRVSIAQKPNSPIFFMIIAEQPAQIGRSVWSEDNFRP